jgi:prepilin-type N-terminal cleavage/methylation domain-containing protein
MKMKKVIKKNKTKGFTLVEVLAVLVIIALLMAIAVPASISVSKKVRTKMLSNKIQLAEKAAALWADDNLTCLRNDSSSVRCDGKVSNCKNTNNVLTCNITLGTLAGDNYLDYDTKDTTTQQDIVQNPVNKTSLNDEPVTITLNLNNNSVSVKPINIATIVSKIAVTITGNNCTKTYNGQEQSCLTTANSSTITSNDDKYDATKYTFDLSGCTVSATNPGKYDLPIDNVVIKDKSTGDDVTSKFNITSVPGSLEITKPSITLTASSCTLSYNGKDQTCAGINTTDLRTTYFTLQNNGSTITKTDAGDYVVPVKYLIYLKNTTTDVSKNFNVTEKTGKLSISKANVTITSNSCSFVYDKTEKTCSGATVTSGSIYDTLNTSGCSVSGTEISTYTVPNTSSIVSGTTNVEKNYNITRKTGTLTIKKEDPVSNTVTINSDDNGQSYVNGSYYTGVNPISVVKNSCSVGDLSFSTSGQYITYTGNAYTNNVDIPGSSTYGDANSIASICSTCSNYGYNWSADDFICIPVGLPSLGSGVTCYNQETASVTSENFGNMTSITGFSISKKETSTTLTCPSSFFAKKTTHAGTGSSATTYVDCYPSTYNCPGQNYYCKNSSAKLNGTSCYWCSDGSTPNSSNQCLTGTTAGTSYTNYPYSCSVTYYYYNS